MSGRETPLVVRRLGRRALRLRNRLLGKRTLWRLGKRGELEFWDGPLGATELENRLDPAAPVRAPLSGVLPRLEGESIRVIDVGAGPITTLGKVAGEKQLEVTAIDPLADDYNRTLERHGIEPPVRTQFGEAERLEEQFGRDCFDVAYSENALDHTYDPVTAVENMLSVVRPGGAVVLRHGVNEAEARNYRGMHQWNFDQRDGAFWIWNQGTARNVTEVLGDLARVECEVEGDRLTCLIWKAAE